MLTQTKNISTEAIRIRNAIASGMVCCADRKTTQQVLLLTEGWEIIGGVMHKIIAKHIGVGIYEIKTKRAN